jgi:hypothetical protein
MKDTILRHDGLWRSVLGYDPKAPVCRLRWEDYAKLQSGVYDPTETPPCGVDSS